MAEKFAQKRPVVGVRFFLHPLRRHGPKNSPTQTLSLFQEGPVREKGETTKYEKGLVLLIEVPDSPFRQLEVAVRGLSHLFPPSACHKAR